VTGKDYYNVLGLGRDATDKDIKQAYRRLARQHHPDVNPGNKAAESRFKEINEANEVLADPEKRRKYDKYGDQWQHAEQIEKAQAEARARGGRSGGFGDAYTYREFGDIGDAGDMGSLFENLFGGGGGGQFRRARAPQAGGDAEHEVEVTLEEAFAGATRRLQMQVEEVCPSCGGRGIVGRRPCGLCGGQGVQARLKRLEVKVPPGVRTGSRIRIAGEGQPGSDGGPKGDLYLLIKVLPHKQFERAEDDLSVEVPVSLVTAVLGGEVEVPTLNGKVALRIPPETQNGRLFRLAGQGMPHLGSASRGDLFARIKVVLPTNLSDEERRLFEQLRALRGYHDTK